MKTYYVRFGSGDPRSNSGLSPTFLTFNNYGTAVTPPGITSVIGATGFYAFQYGTTTPIVFLIDGATSGLDNSVRYVAGSIDPVDRADEYGTTLVAIGSSNIALGTSSVALGTTMVAIGTSNIALGTSNFALGTTNFALGTTNFAIGTSNNALGTSNFALGTTNFALATSILAQGVTITSYVSSFGAGNSGTAEILLRMGSTASTFGTSAADPVDIFGFLKRLQEFNEGNQSFDKVGGAWTINSRGGSLLATKTLTNSSTQVSKS